MADEPSSAVSPSVEAPAETASAPETEQRAPSIFERLFGRRQTAPETDATPEPTEGTEPATPKPATLTLTEDELEKRIQAETDRREAKRQQEAERKRAAEERKRLREEDPWAYVEQEKQQEQVEAANQTWQDTLGNVVRSYDEATLTPLLEALPEADRARLVADESINKPGLDGRKAFAAALRKEIEKQALKAAEQRLRKNPAFRQELLAELRGTDDEPDEIPARGPSRPQDMNALIRGALGRVS